ncbi:MAG: DUF4339 domain-containing protein [Verrucomicrobiota bacterium]
MPSPSELPAYYAPVLALTGREIVAYASIALAVIGLALFFKYLPRWVAKSQGKKPAKGPGGGTPSPVGAGMPDLPPAVGEANILLLREGQQLGPYTADQVRHLVAYGQFDINALCWQPGQADWKPIREVLGG